MPASYIQAYKKYPGNQFFVNTGSEVSVTLRSGVWQCNAGGCTLTSKTGECWTWCDASGANCQLMCKGRKGKRGECWEECDASGRHCRVVCRGGVEKRQCREGCDEAGRCESECVDEPRETCWQACDPTGGNCSEECLVIGHVEA